MMKGYVITIETMEQSVQCAERCIKSAGRVGFDVQRFAASTPSDNPSEYLAQRGVSVEGFKEVYSRFDNCVAAFTSHYRLWEQSFTNKETLVVLEHDAYFTDAIPSYAPFASIINFGKPSYGKWVTPSVLGVNALISKQYLPGAHAYGITPAGAKQLLDKAQECASPTDVFISNKNFSGIQEYYPWPVEARDSFSTIQKVQGCLAKHNYGETYELI
jgi:GR25 family glycosyltransferase involved in LPS biosynthesis